jgi:recombination protein RecT
MTTKTPAVQTAQKTVARPKDFFNQDNVKAKFAELMGKRSAAFLSSVLQCVAQNSDLAQADVNSIYQSAMMAATLDLPINNNLGFAYIIPYNQKDGDNWKKVAQFQLGYKGFIQLAQRSGQFKTISATPIYDGQLKSVNPLTGFEFDFSVVPSGEPVGYAAYFSLINGFEKTLYMTKEEMTKHGTSYSKTFKFGVWKNNFDAMALKTVTKLLLSKYAPLSIEMQKAVASDQSIINDAETVDTTYVDNEPLQLNHEEQRVIVMIEDCTNLQDLEGMRAYINGEDAQQAFNSKYHELGGK